MRKLILILILLLTGNSLMADANPKQQTVSQRQNSPKDIKEIFDSMEEDEESIISVLNIAKNISKYVKKEDLKKIDEIGGYGYKTLLAAVSKSKNDLIVGYKSYMLKDTVSILNGNDRNIFMLAFKLGGICHNVTDAISLMDASFHIPEKIKQIFEIGYRAGGYFNEALNNVEAMNLLMKPGKFLDVAGSELTDNAKSLFIMGFTAGSLPRAHAYLADHNNVNPISRLIYQVGYNIGKTFFTTRSDVVKSRRSGSRKDWKPSTKGLKKRKLFGFLHNLRDRILDNVFGSQDVYSYNYDATLGTQMLYNENLDPVYDEYAYGNV